MKKLEDTIDFLLVGTAKSGTTSVFHAITQHPKIFVPISSLFADLMSI